MSKAAQRKPDVSRPSEEAEFRAWRDAERTEQSLKAGLDRSVRRGHSLRRWTLGLTIGSALTAIAVWLPSAWQSWRAGQPNAPGPRAAAVVAKLVSPFPDREAIERDLQCWATGEKQDDVLRGRPLRFQDFYCDASMKVGGPTFQLWFDDQDRIIAMSCGALLYSRPELNSARNLLEEDDRRRYDYVCARQLLILSDFLKRYAKYEGFNYLLWLGRKDLLRDRRADGSVEYSRVDESGPFLVDVTVTLKPGARPEDSLTTVLVIIKAAAFW